MVWPCPTEAHRGRVTVKTQYTLGSGSDHVSEYAGSGANAFGRHHRQRRTGAGRHGRARAPGDTRCPACNRIQARHRYEPSHSARRAGVPAGGAISPGARSREVRCRAPSLRVRIRIASQIELSWWPVPYARPLVRAISSTLGDPSERCFSQLRDCMRGHRSRSERGHPAR